MAERHIIRKGYVKVNNKGKLLWATFTEDQTFGGKCGWKYVESVCTIEINEECDAGIFTDEFNDIFD